MKKFCLLINQSPTVSDKSEHAILFAESILKIGDTINSIFFYQNGVYNCDKNIVYNINTINLYKRWKQIHKNYCISLYVCSTSIINRGIKNSNIISLKKNIYYINKCFILTSLITLHKCINSSNYFIQF